MKTPHYKKVYYALPPTKACMAGMRDYPGPTSTPDMYSLIGQGSLSPPATWEARITR